MNRNGWAGAAAALALSGSPGASPQEAIPGGRIEVTGSRIASPDLEGASPVVRIDAEDIRIDGRPSIELLLNTIPQIVGDQGNRVSNGATGTATVDLRGLGATRTMVLVNGRRLPAGSPRSAAADLSQLPIALIERIDVLTGGASAVYGSDAIGGVVNFILDRRFAGVRGEVSYDFHNHRQHNPGGVAEVIAELGATNPTYRVPRDKSRDGESTRASLTLGHNFAGDRGNATVSLSYLETRALATSERDYSACPVFFDEGRVQCGGSGAATFPARVVDLASFSSWAPADAAGRVRRWGPGTDRYNAASSAYYQRPGERYGVHASAEYELRPGHRLYGEFGHHDDRTAAAIAPSGVFLEFVPVRFDNPLLSAEWRSTLGLTERDLAADVLIGRRNVEGGARIDDIRHRSYREVAGIKGALSADWTYDLFQQFGKVDYRSSFENDFSRTRALRALDVVTHPDTGTAVCASTLDGSDPACVPYDIWRLGGVTPEALSYLQLTATNKGYTSQQVVGMTISGDLGGHGIRFPGSKAGVEAVLGAERRVERLRMENDAAFLSGDLTSPAYEPVDVDGSYTVKELFGEVRVPVSDRLGLGGAYRYSDYSTGRKTHTYGLGFELAAMRPVRLRGSYQRAVRAANIVELFTPLGLGPGALDDPCAGSTPSASLAECQRTGVTAARYGRIPSNFDESGGPGVYGGNPALEPEAASTRTLGILLAPAKGVNVAIDYFDIRIEDKVGVTPPNVTLGECLRTGESRLCSLIVRDPATGALWIGGGHILAINQNVGRSRVSGIDVSVALSHDLAAYGNVAIGFLGSWLRRWEEEPYPGATAYDCAGLFGVNCGAPRPRWRHRARVTWATPWQLDATLTWRYMGLARHESRDSHPLLSRRLVSEADSEADLQTVQYLDLAATWKIDRRLTLRAGINNLLDRDPPLIVFGAPANGFAQGYDALGRHVYVSLTARF